ncbi:MAG: TIGR03960 family B12-binding radical SAM protein [Clostridia bacterium]|nr:TIGR03960 family B12-binding radical SAM protein [Clostridia bacterium]
MREDIRPFLADVEKPGRYSGGEPGSVFKDPAEVDLRVAFCFPDTYEIGMSNLGMRILTQALNEVDGVWCERVYAPWVDMEDEMRTRGIPLFTHESGDSVGDFDIVAFTLQYEMCYTNVLNMMDLAGIPLRASERGEDAPILLAGGPCAYNAEPMAPFIDIFSIGEGEEALPELAQLYLSMKRDGSYTKSAFLRAAARLEGFYVPSLYEIAYHENGTVASITPKYDDVPAKVKKRIVADVDHTVVPTCPVMPLIETVQDRVTLEVYRGCIRGCRFCQAGFISRPVREKSVPVLCDIARETVENTGYEEISLMSLSISDYTDIGELTDRLLTWTDEKKINLALPSLRADSFTKELMDKVSSVRTSTLTFAPEAGTQRLRDVINKNVTEEEILNACRIAFDAGKNQVKLYFMNGLPGETEEDLAGIAELAKHVLDEFYKTPGRNKARPPQVTISVACFIPKPMTPFQWEPQDTMESLMQKQKFLSSKITDRKIRYNYHDARTSHIEAVLARGDRRLADALELAQKEGFRFDAWEDHFDYDKWMDVLRRTGADPAFYANRSIPDDEILPWDMIDCGVSKSFLLRERHKAHEGDPTPACRDKCSGCGADSLTDKKNCTWCPGGKMRSGEKTEKPFSSMAPAKPYVPAEKGTPGFVPPVDPHKTIFRPVRVRFTKRHPALFIGHLDLQRIMTHIVTRSGLPVYYSEGYNPRPKLVFGSPLSVGCGAEAEVVDIRVRAEVSCQEIREKLAAMAPDGVDILEVYESSAKLSEVENARCRLTFHTPRASAEGAAQIEKRFASPVIMMKKSKSGEKEVDITTLIRSLTARYDEENRTIVVEAVTACGNTSHLNPEYIADAIARETDLITPDSWHETVRAALLLADGVTEFR